MKISQFLRKYHLHDSPVDSINYQSEAKHLVFVITLCDWSGEVKDPEEVFGQSGTLIFEGVQQLQANPPLESLSWEWKSRPEILDLVYKAELDREGLEGVWGLILLSEKDEDKGYVKVLEIKFVATHFEWRPDT